MKEMKNFSQVVDVLSFKYMLNTTVKTARYSKEKSGFYRVFFDGIQ